MCRGAPIGNSLTNACTDIVITITKGLAYLGKRHVGNYDDVEGRRSVLLHTGITTGVVLVWAGATRLPGLAVLSLGNGALGRGAGGRAGCASSAWGCTVVRVLTSWGAYRSASLRVRRHRS